MIRTAILDDAQALLDIYTPYVLNTTITFETEVPTLSDFTQRIKSIQQRFPYLVLEVDNEIIGYAYATKYKERSAYDWTVETSVYIRQDVQARGYGKQLYTALEEALRTQGIVTMLACITYPNDLSIEFHKKMGFEHVAHFEKLGYKFNQWRDIVWMKKVINPYF